MVRLVLMLDILSASAQLCRSIMPLIVGHIAQRRMRRLNPASPL
jgi:hypothetical protein